MQKLIILMCFLFAYPAMGQNSWFLNFQDEIPSISPKVEKTKFKNLKEAQEELNSIFYKAKSKGYLLASIDSTFIDSSAQILFVWFNNGPKFDEAQILVLEENQQLIRQINGLSEKMLLQTPFRPAEISSQLKKILRHLENNGYPFAKVQLKETEIIDKKLFANLSIETGPYVAFIKIHLKGEPKVSRKFLENYIRIKEGDNYAEDKLEYISQRIEQVPFLKEIKPHEILFTPEGAEVFLYLESLPVSSINGVVGLQPNTVTNKLTLTGDIRLKLQNVLKKGELIGFNWRSIKPATQNLNIEFNYPFLFNTPFGIDTDFSLYKQDSSFVDIKAGIGVQYYLNGGNYIQAFYKNEQSNLLSGISSSSLGRTASTSVNYYGLSLFGRTLDYIPNPSKGLIFELSASVGSRFSKEQDSISVAKSTVYKSSLSIDYFFPLARRHVLHFQNQTQFYVADEIFDNEVFRFGGLNSQRGFNEEEILATTLAYFSIEYRFLVDRNSHAFAFYDQTIYENNSTGYLRDTPLGFGAGFSFGTNIGIFSISYALGKQLNNPILIRQGKVHFGYVAYF